MDFQIIILNFVQIQILFHFSHVNFLQLISYYDLQIDFVSNNNLESSCNFPKKVMNLMHVI